MQINEGGDERAGREGEGGYLASSVSLSVVVESAVQKKAAERGWKKKKRKNDQAWGLREGGGGGGGEGGRDVTDKRANWRESVIYFN